MERHEELVRSRRRTPDFANLLAVLGGTVPNRPTLFEFYLNPRIYERLAGRLRPPASDLRDLTRFFGEAFSAAGYDYVTLITGDYFPESRFPIGARHEGRSHSLNEGGLVVDEASFEAYPWPNMEALDYGALDLVARGLPEGMKAIVSGPMGVMEILNDIVGYERLCFLVIDNPDFVERIASEIGRRLLSFYERCLAHPVVGAVIANDDWGFKTQTMLSLADLRRFVFPWHRRIVEAAHAAHRPVILHSCGQLDEVMDEIIDDLRMDGKHSFEDAILPVEKAYARWGSRIALLGGIDVDFLCKAPLKAIHDRAARLLAKTGCRRWALGSGNSIPDYVTDEAYFAMISAAFE